MRAQVINQGCMTVTHAVFRIGPTIYIYYLDCTVKSCGELYKVQMPGSVPRDSDFGYLVLKKNNDKRHPSHPQFPT